METEAIFTIKKSRFVVKKKHNNNTVQLNCMRIRIIEIRVKGYSFPFTHYPKSLAYMVYALRVFMCLICFGLLID